MAELESRLEVRASRMKERAESHAAALTEMIYKTHGAWFIKVHAYSRAEILQDPLYARLEGTAASFQQEIEFLKNHDGLSNYDAANFLNIYLDTMDFIDDLIDRIHRDLVERKPTWWERVEKFAERVFYLLVDALPKRLVSSIADAKRFLGID